MRSLVFVGVMLVSASAFAKDITLTLNDQEQKVFLTLLDAALKNGGLANLQAVAKFVTKYQAAASASATPEGLSATPDGPPKP